MTDNNPDTAVDAPQTAEQATALPATTRARFVAAMREVGHVGKREQANMGRGGSFNFRGIDAVMNAVGPAFRKYGIFLMPELISEEYERVPRGNGGMMVTTRVRVRYHIMSETGDGEFSGTAIGEANDTADKATAKAMSVALRTFLLQSLVLPTDEPDPDLSYNEIGAHHQQQRGQAPAAPADPGRLIYRDKAFDPQRADKATLLRAVWQAKQVGDRATYDQLAAIGKKRFDGSPAPAPEPQHEQPQPPAAPADEDPWANAPEAQA